MASKKAAPKAKRSKKAAPKHRPATKRSNKPASKQDTGKPGKNMTHVDLQLTTDITEYDPTKLAAHPILAGLLPEPHEDSKRALLESMQDNIDAGRRAIDVPLVVNSKGYVIDGMTRLMSAQVMKLATVPIDVRTDLSEEDETDLGLKLNTARRQLTTAQRSSLAKKLIRDYPEWSNRMIARNACVSPATVGNIRKDMEAKGKVKKSTTRKTASGKTQKVSSKTRKKAAKKAQSKRSRKGRNDQILSVVGYYDPPTFGKDTRQAVKDWTDEHWSRFLEWRGFLARVSDLQPSDSK